MTSSLARFPIVVTAPVGGAVSARFYRDGGSAAAVVYDAEAAGSAVSQPATVAAGDSLTVYSPEQVIEVSCTVAGVEVAGGRGAKKRVYVDGQINVSPDVPAQAYLASVTKAALVADPTGGATIDTQSRTAIAAVIDALIALGLMEAS